MSQTRQLFWIKQQPVVYRKPFKDLFLRRSNRLKKDKPFISCCEEFIIYETSVTRNIIVYTTFFNIMYNSLFVPFIIGFDIKVTGVWFYIECITHFISFAAFVLQFKTPVVLESGEYSLQLSVVFQNYLKNGFWLDLLAFLPFNLVLPFYFDDPST